MISRFFIDRPVFANVIAFITVLIGVVALYFLPVERYPSLTPPTLVVTAFYPGANAKVVADTVATPIEQAVNGVQNMMYMSSSSNSDGSYNLTLTFEIGTDMDSAQVLVQNRLASVEPSLPEEVRRLGVRVFKQSTNLLLVISLTSKSKTYDSLFLSNYATLRLRDELSRVPGVGGVGIGGAGAYSMRVWLDPDKLAARQLTTSDVVAALGRQNVQVAPGQIGQPPNPPSQVFQMTVTALGRLTEVAEFEGIIVRAGGAGQIVYLRDVARVELGAVSYSGFETRSGMDAANILIYQLPGSNSLDVTKAVRDSMVQIGPSLPTGMEYEVPFDSSRFVNAAINSVYTTLYEAGVLVLVVILVFLQSWRALLIPATTVPVTIIGAFAFMPLLGFSVNLLTLFGLILAIGIVVDDAIVIVENAAHQMEKGYAPREATIRAMGEVTGPIISITLVLMAVFVPTAFLPGITGQLYRQFALTIAATAVISAVNALTLKPAQCAQYLRPHTGRGWATRLFDFFYRPVDRLYAWCVRLLVRVWWLVLLVFVVLTVFTGWLYLKTPTGFFPTEDEGYVIIFVQLPDAASVDRSREVTEMMNPIFEKYRDRGAVENWFVGGGAGGATVYVTWTEWSKRATPELQQQALVQAIQADLNKIPEANFYVIVPPAIPGLGLGGGFEMRVEDRDGVGVDALLEQTQAVVDEAKKRPEIDANGTSTRFRSAVPQVYLDINREKAEKMGVKLNDVYAALQVYLGSVYVNDFNKFDRAYQVRVQADTYFRNDPERIRQLEVRNRDGGRVPLGTLLSAEPRVGPPSIDRYNMYTTATINGRAAPGVSSGDALRVMEDVAKKTLPRSMGFDWTGIAYQEKRVSRDTYLVFGLAVLFVYLVLAAQYESWLLPFAVILVVPLGLLGVVGAVSLKTMLSGVMPGVTPMDNNVYTQIGIVLIIALASKNAILIVEFARDLRKSGRTVREAAVEAARARFRPIIMTSVAFILGVVPLLVATGAGAASRQSLGTAVFGGMITSTVLAVFFVPAFYVAIQSFIELWRRSPSIPPAESHTTPA